MNSQFNLQSAATALLASWDRQRASEKDARKPHSDGPDRHRGAPMRVRAAKN
jgi:hypothetical protein